MNNKEYKYNSSEKAACFIDSPRNPWIVGDCPLDSDSQKA